VCASHHSSTIFFLFKHAQLPLPTSKVVPGSENEQIACDMLVDGGGLGQGPGQGLDAPLTIGGVLKEIQGLKDKFKNEDDEEGVIWREAAWAQAGSAGSSKHHLCASPAQFEHLPVCAVGNGAASRSWPNANRRS
jgi:hypothetical protein